VSSVSGSSKKKGDPRYIGRDLGASQNTKIHQSVQVEKRHQRDFPAKKRLSEKNEVGGARVEGGGRVLGRLKK